MARRDQTTGELVKYVFVRQGKLVSASTLFDDAFRTVCAAAGLVDPQGQPTVSAHRLRHTIGTQLAEGGARLQTIMAVLGHKSSAMAMIYTRISDPEVRRQYEAALTAGQRIAGPAAEALLRGQMSDEAVDTGVGIDADSLPHVGTKFFRARTATEAAIPGLGLGVMITKTIIDAHGGTLTFSSREGGGTTATVHLPHGGYPSEVAADTTPRSVASAGGSLSHV
jgi:hypothetical protein